MTVECRKITILEMYHDRDGLADTKKSIDNQVHVSHRVFRALRRNLVKCMLLAIKCKRNIFDFKMTYINLANGSSTH